MSVEVKCIPGTVIEPDILNPEPGMIIPTVIICKISDDLLCTLDRTIRDNRRDTLETGNLNG